MKLQKILVVGSSNTDMVIKTDHIPCPGETILGENFLMNPGGKGANQAVAIARLGSNVTFACKTGRDIFGHQSHQLFEAEGIDTTYIISDSKFASGIAMITVDKNAENCITVSSGANMNFKPADLEKLSKSIDEFDIVLMQLEIPMETVEYVAKLAAEKGKKVILNPAPAPSVPLSTDLIQSLFLITPNETEAELITGQKVTDIETAKKAAQIMRDKGTKNVIITLGSKGALVYTDTLCEVIPAFRVKAVDTTAAGDIFNGALCVALSEGRGWAEAIRFACKTSAISVTRVGAQSSAPYRAEVDVFNI